MCRTAAGQQLAAVFRPKPHSACSVAAPRRGINTVLKAGQTLWSATSVGAADQPLAAVSVLEWQSPPARPELAFSHFQALINAFHIHWVNRTTVGDYHRRPALCRRKLLHNERHGVLDALEFSISSAELIAAVRGPFVLL